MGVTIKSSKSVAIAVENKRGKNKKDVKKYVQSYRKAWEADIKYKDWISPHTIPNSSKAFCKWCHVSIRPHKKSLDDHAATDKHLVNANSHNSSMPKIIKFVKHPISEQRKIAELKLAAFVAKYCSMNVATQLAKVVGSLDSNSEILQNLTLGKTKCTGLIVNVLSPCLLYELISDIGDAYYSLIIDESTYQPDTEWHLVNSKIIADKKESTEDYWNRVDKITTAGEDKRYGHISKLVLALLALPLSNATVERAFSLVSIIKDKLRNRLAIKSCEAVMRIRYNITEVDLFQPSKSMLNHFTSEEVYASEFQEKILMVIEDGAKEQYKEEEEEEGQDFI